MAKVEIKGLLSTRVLHRMEPLTHLHAHRTTHPVDSRSQGLQHGELIPKHKGVGLILSCRLGMLCMTLFGEQAQGYPNPQGFSVLGNNVFAALRKCHFSQRKKM